MLSKVQGQDEAVTLLRRVVEGHLRSPLLLVGNEGVGRKFSALQAVKEVFSGGDSSSNFCLQVDQLLHPDLTLITPEGDKEIGVDTVREVLRSAYNYPMFSTRRFFIVDGVDRMTSAASNAFLKTLEEPPAFTQFFLLAESSEAVLPTIRSRCGKLRYKRLSETFIVDTLKDLVSDPLIARVYARLAEGSVGRAVQFFGSNRLQLRDRSFSLLKTCLSKDLSSIFASVDGFDKDLKLALHFLDLLLYDLLMLPHAPDRIVNLDLANELGVVRSQLGDARLRTILRVLKTVKQRMRSAKVSLPFQVKTALGTTFSE